MPHYPRYISRRRMLGMLATPLAFAPMSGCKLRLLNPCLDAALPEPLASHELVTRAFDGLDPAKIIDTHVHLLGTGDSGGGAWVGRQMASPLNLLQYARYRFFLNASCIQRDTELDAAFLERLLACHRAAVRGSRLMLLAFDQVYAPDGQARPEISAFHIPNEYARAVAARYPGELEWAASVHPYRADAVEALDAAVASGALALKWLPNAMGIGPAAPRCDRFYEALARHRLPLLTHGGGEQAVHGTGMQELGNPLRLRRALDHGVRVIVAHCASEGDGIDTDAGPDGPTMPNIKLFARLMNEPRYEHLLMGDISALTQSNRLYGALDLVLEHTDWHARLLNGSDYPLPGVMALFSLDRLVKLGFLEASAAPILETIQGHNPLLFDFVLKRSVSSNGIRFAPGIFETARHLEPPSAPPNARRDGMAP